MNAEVTQGLSDRIDLSAKAELRQKQILAPHVFQSLRVLGLPVAELREMIEAELSENPILEVEDYESREEDVPEEEDREPDEEEIAWEEFAEHLEAAEAPVGSVVSRDEETTDAASLVAQPTTLADHLSFQLHLQELSANERKIGEAIIGSINDDGYLERSAEDIAGALGVDAARVEAVLRVIQTFDPPGVAARDLTECLKLQLDYLGVRDPKLDELISAHLDDLARKRYEKIARALRTEPELVRRYADLVRTLSPRPGALFRTSGTTSYVTADVVIRELDGRLVVMGNEEAVPALSINPLYRRMLADENADAQTRQYVKAKLKSAVELIRSIDRRRDTLAKIARLILSHQREFFLNGPRALKPLTRAQVARELGMHASTVSRALAGKYMQTPFGTFEFKYFFSGGYESVSGDNVSATSVKRHIRDLIEAEPAGRPHSDKKLAELLRTQGFDISRRTVAKYRGELRIEPSYRRK